MARPKGLKKTGGRQRGTENRATSTIKNWVQNLLDENRQVFEDDLKKLEPPQRVQILEKMLKYTIPTLQSVDMKAQVEAQVSAEYAALENLLKNAPDDAVSAIADKVKTLNELSKTRK